ncbi:Matrixin [Nocardioides scoriae]|uniref:Matrixin n=1 Tax=Nocardioides scoriae TaxID=642780 RepID=A0A1H1RGI6_9ACTN|nr:matrixin family metalloprotease [Nocardioides scoriae]SDS34805.1 Matrixin [Nocardioides scoriae]
MRNLAVTVLSLLLLGGLVVVFPGLVPSALRPALTPALGGRLDPAPEAPRSGGTFAFSATQPGRPRVPVTYSPCDPVRIELNLDGAPDPVADRASVERAVARIAGATGLRLEVVGESTDRPRWTEGRVRLDPGVLRDPDPVLVSFADSDEVPQLQGRVAGLAGSVLVEQDGFRRYVTGQVTLDRDSFAELRDQPGGDEIADAIALHELGHLVGLDHVDDPRELMYATTTDQRDLGPGDRRGLAALGRGRCG